MKGEIMLPFIIEIINLSFISTIINIFHPPVPPVNKLVYLYGIYMPSIASVSG